mmetsp:Transcript_13628/g.25606  ORF Transcript_13628/g.25606 Transcript_13628/m.25606 type:complete len:83 (+) Transcript_13628:1980-2228(+)
MRRDLVLAIDPHHFNGISHLDDVSMRATCCLTIIEIIIENLIFMELMLTLTSVFCRLHNMRSKHATQALSTKSVVSKFSNKN